MSCLPEISDTQTGCRTLVASPILVERQEDSEVKSESTITPDDFLQSGEIIATNFTLVRGAVSHVVRLVCDVVEDISEADTIGPVLRKAAEKLGLTMRHGASAIQEIHEAMVCSVAVVNFLQRDDWIKLHQHVQAFREHTRHVHELWPQNLTFIDEELVPSLSAHFYPPGGALPHIGYWIARITRTEHLPTTRLDTWRQISTLIADIRTALDLLPDLFAKVEAYTLGFAAQVEILFMSSSTGPNAKELQSLKPTVRELYSAWAGIRTAAHASTCGVEQVMKRPRLLPRSRQFWHPSVPLIRSDSL